MTEEKIQDSEARHSSYRMRMVADQGKSDEEICVYARRFRQRRALQ